METTEKHETKGRWIKPDPPKQEGPLVEPIHLPDNEEYFTVRRIIKLAKVYFQFDINFDDSGRNIRSKRTAEEKVKLDRQYNSVKKYINRKLEGKPAKEGKGHDRMYSREIVHDFFNDLEHQKYFLVKSVEVNRDEKKRVHNELYGVKGERMTDEEKNTLKEWEQILEERIQKLCQRQNRLDDSEEVRKEFGRMTDKFLDSFIDDEDNSLNLTVEWCKKKILFDALFDSFIKLDEEMLRKDIMLLPEDLVASDEEILASVRFSDLRNYYTLKYDLSDALKIILKLLETIETQTKPTTVFKESDKTKPNKKPD